MGGIRVVAGDFSAAFVPVDSCFFVACFQADVTGGDAGVAYFSVDLADVRLFSVIHARHIPYVQYRNMRWVTVWLSLMGMGVTIMCIRYDRPRKHCGERVPCA